MLFPETNNFFHYIFEKGMSENKDIKGFHWNDWKFAVPLKNRCLIMKSDNMGTWESEKCGEEKPYVCEKVIATTTTAGTTSGTTSKKSGSTIQEMQSSERTSPWAQSTGYVKPSTDGALDDAVPLAAGAGAGFFFLVLLVILLVYCRYKRRKHAKPCHQSLETLVNEADVTTGTISMKTLDETRAKETTATRPPEGAAIQSTGDYNSHANIHINGKANTEKLKQQSNLSNRSIRVTDSSATENVTSQSNVLLSKKESFPNDVTKKVGQPIDCNSSVYVQAVCASPKNNENSLVTSRGERKDGHKMTEEKKRGVTRKNNTSESGGTVTKDQGNDEITHAFKSGTKSQKGDKSSKKKKDQKKKKEKEDPKLTSEAKTNNEALYDKACFMRPDKQTVVCEKGEKKTKLTRETKTNNDAVYDKACFMRPIKDNVILDKQEKTTNLIPETKTNNVAVYDKACFMRPNKDNVIIDKQEKTTNLIPETKPNDEAVYDEPCFTRPNKSTSVSHKEGRTQKLTPKTKPNNETMYDRACFVRPKNTSVNENEERRTDGSPVSVPCQSDQSGSVDQEIYEDALPAKNTETNAKGNQTVTSKTVQAKTNVMQKKNALNDASDCVYDQAVFVKPDEVSGSGLSNKNPCEETAYGEALPVQLTIGRKYKSAREKNVAAKYDMSKEKSWKSETRKKPVDDMSSKVVYENTVFSANPKFKSSDDVISAANGDIYAVPEKKGERKTSVPANHRIQVIPNQVVLRHVANKDDNKKADAEDDGKIRVESVILVDNDIYGEI